MPTRDPVPRNQRVTSDPTEGHPATLTLDEAYRAAFYLVRDYVARESTYGLTRRGGATGRQPSQVVGYFALAVGQVERETAPRRLAKGVGRHPIPVVILTRLAVDVRHQGRGLGTAQLVDALRKVDLASGSIGVRALLIHAESIEAKAFYLNFAEFEASPTDPLHLILLMKDLRRAIHEAATQVP